MDQILRTEIASVETEIGGGSMTLEHVLNGSLKVRGGEAIGEIAATSNAHLPLAVALASMIGAWLHELKESRSGCGAFVGCC